MSILMRLERLREKSAGIADLSILKGRAFLAQPFFALLIEKRAQNSFRNLTMPVTISHLFRSLFMKGDVD